MSLAPKPSDTLVSLPHGHGLLCQIVDDAPEVVATVTEYDDPMATIRTTQRLAAAWNIIRDIPLPALEESMFAQAMTGFAQFLLQMLVTHTYDGYTITKQPNGTVNITDPRGFVVNSTTAEFAELLKQYVAEKTQTHD